MASFVTESCVQRLGLKRKKHSVTIHGIGGNVCSKSSGYVTLPLDSHVRGFAVDCVILPQLTRTLPSDFVPVAKLQTLNNVNLADPQFNVPGPIDVILGMDVYHDVVLNNKIRDRTLVALETIFGWVVSGSIPDNSRLNSLHGFHVERSEELDLRRFWEIEEVPTASTATPDELACEKHFVDTTTRTADGRYVVKLPFRDNKPPNLDFTSEIARRRLLSIERRFRHDNVVRDAYHDFINEFLALKHLEKIPQHEIAKPSGTFAYLPHHIVKKESSTTTKYRVVFDGSAASADGTSLNGSILVGGRLQDDLFHILVRFRLHPIALSADIAKMYRQVALDTNDCDFHRILWRTDSTKPIEHYRLVRVTYGIASSAFHSIRTLHAIADSEPESLASPVLKRDFYVDDLLSGAHTVAGALAVQASLIDVLKRGGFEIRKWSSNDPAMCLRTCHLTCLRQRIRISTNRIRSKPSELGGTLPPTASSLCFLRTQRNN